MCLLNGIAFGLVAQADAIHYYKNDWAFIIQLAHAYSIASCYNIYMSVRDYYLEHFDELPLDKQKHLVTRLKYGLHEKRFDDFLAAHEPSHELAAVLANNDYAGVNNYVTRREFFEKYPDLYGVEATLFRINRLLIEYQVDLRADFEQLYPLERLYRLCDDLLADLAALFALSTYAVNVICLSENLFPRRREVYTQLAESFLNAEQQPDLIYAYTHIILCMSDYYVRAIPADWQTLSAKMLTKCEQLITAHYDTISLDVKLEFLVCAKMVNFATNLRAQIEQECDAILEQHAYLIDERRPAKYNTLTGAEHRNVLYMISGLDY